MERYDQLRYLGLVENAEVDFNLALSGEQDQSSRGLVMTIAGAPVWARLASWPCLGQRANADGAASGAVAAIVDVTAAFWVEALFVPHIDPTTTDALLYQQAAGTGGFDLVWDPATDIVTLTLYTNAGAVARTISTAANTVVPNVPLHVIISSTAGGTAGSAWIRGVPSAVALGGAAAAANTAGAAVGYGRGTGLVDFVILRAFSGTPTNPDATAIYLAARNIVDGAV